MNALRILFFCFAGCLGLFSHAQVSITSLNELYQIADSTAFNSRIQDNALLSAELTKQASYGYIFNPRIPVNASLIDNTELPVNFIPADVFGGAPGTFREVIFGQQFISTLTITPQLDIIAPGKWEEVQMANYNLEKTKAEGNLSKRDVRNAIANYYIHYILLEKQKELLYWNIILADSIYRSVKEKVKHGMARESDANEALINVVKQKTAVQNLEAQSEKNLLQLENILGIVVEINDSWEESVDVFDNNSQFELEKLKFQKLYAQSALKASRLDHLPDLSFVSSFAYQNNSNSRFLDNNERWINSNYIGLRLTWEFPSNIQKLTELKSRRINYELASIQYEQAIISLKNKAIENKLELNRLQMEWISMKEIKLLEQENFIHALTQYEEGIIPMEKLLRVQLNKIQSELNEESAHAAWAKQIEIIRNGL